ncbi:MAG: phosphatase PAP2 family protein [Bacilli bacterium]|jgi:membrane-associated phospholipid phosphatase|nr:phosphatase PAP2 family protein [Bacilli bacterium]
MRKKWLFVPVFALIALGIVLGSFYDLAIAQSLYSSRNGFGLFMAAVGELPCYAGLSFIGGLLLSLELRDDKVLWRRILVIALGVLVTGFGVYYAGKAIISRNAYDVEGMWYLGWPISFLLCGLAYSGGFFFARKCDDPHWRRDLLCMIAAIFLALLLTTLVKKFDARPRYRWLVGETSGSVVPVLGDFHNWWESANGLRATVLGTDPGLAEEFKSFPSGHVTSASVALLIAGCLPRLDSRLAKHDVLLFAIGFIWMALVAYSRMLIGAHFLSDVSFGALFTTSSFFVFDLILYPIGKGKAENASHKRKA